MKNINHGVRFYKNIENRSIVFEMGFTFKEDSFSAPLEQRLFNNSFTFLYLQYL